MTEGLPAGSLEALVAALSAGRHVGMALFTRNGELVALWGTAEELFNEYPGGLQHPQLSTVLSDRTAEGMLFEGVMTFGDDATKSTSARGVIAASGASVAILLEPLESLAPGVVDTLATMVRESSVRERALDRRRLAERRKQRILTRALDVAVDANTTDQLTGVASRQHLLQRLESNVEAAQADAEPLSAVMLDLDHFKRINDEYGHAAGDQVLQRIGAILLDSCRGSDTAGRYGGEEFLLVLTNTDLDEARSVAERVRRSISVDQIGEVPGITVSAGVAQLEPGETGPELLERADAALYRAKNAGRNCVVPAT